MTSSRKELEDLARENSKRIDKYENSKKAYKCTSKYFGDRLVSPNLKFLAEGLYPKCKNPGFFTRFKLGLPKNTSEEECKNAVYNAYLKCMKP